MTKAKNRKKSTPKFVPSTKKVTIPPITKNGQIELEKLKFKKELCKTLRVPLMAISFIAVLLAVRCSSEETLEKIAVFFKVPSFIIWGFGIILGFAWWILKKGTLTIPTDDDDDDTEA